MARGSASIQDEWICVAMFAFGQDTVGMGTQSQMAVMRKAKWGGELPVVYGFDICVIRPL